MKLLVLSVSAILLSLSEYSFAVRRSPELPPESAFTRVTRDLCKQLLQRKSHDRIAWEEREARQNGIREPGPFDGLSDIAETIIRGQEGFDRARAVERDAGIQRTSVVDRIARVVEEEIVKGKPDAVAIEDARYRRDRFIAQRAENRRRQRTEAGPESEAGPAPETTAASATATKQSSFQELQDRFDLSKDVKINDGLEERHRVFRAKSGPYFLVVDHPYTWSYQWVNYSIYHNPNVDQSPELTREMLLEKGTSFELTDIVWTPFYKLPENLRPWPQEMFSGGNHVVGIVPRMEYGFDLSKEIQLKADLPAKYKLFGSKLGPYFLAVMEPTYGTQSISYKIYVSGSYALPLSDKMVAESGYSNELTERVWGRP